MNSKRDTSRQLVTDIIIDLDDHIVTLSSSGEPIEQYVLEATECAIILRRPRVAIPDVEAPNHELAAYHLTSDETEDV